MLDRQKLETVLLRRFPGATPEQIAAAVNAIMGIENEWEEARREKPRALGDCSDGNASAALPDVGKVD